MSDDMHQARLPEWRGAEGPARIRCRMRHGECRSADCAALRLALASLRLAEGGVSYTRLTVCASFFAQGDESGVPQDSQPEPMARPPSLCQPFSSIAAFHVSTAACISRSD